MSDLFYKPGTKMEPNSSFSSKPSAGKDNLYSSQNSRSASIVAMLGSDRHLSKGNQTLESTHADVSSQVTGSKFLQSTEATDVSGIDQNPAVSNKGHTPSRPNIEHLINQDVIHSTSSSNSLTGFSPSPPSVSVSGNTTSYTFLRLLPYHTYHFQVNNGPL